jgi:hypothetical protein
MLMLTNDLGMLSYKHLHSREAKLLDETNHHWYLIIDSRHLITNSGIYWPVRDTHNVKAKG